MKLFSYLMAFAVLISIYSCSKETEHTPTEQKQTPVAEYLQSLATVENGMLSFNDEESFRTAMITLGSMNYKQRTEWEKSVGFESMQSLCENLSDLLLNVETEEEYWQIRGSYDTKVLFNEPGGDNLAFDIPLEKMGYLPVVNTDGNVKIGGEVKNLKKTARLLKAAGDDLARCKKFRSKDTQILCLVEETGFVDRMAGRELHLYISTQKHHWYSGWTNNPSIRMVKNEGEYFIPLSYLVEPDLLPRPLPPGEVTKTNSEKYSHYYFFQGSPPKPFSFRIWGNGFSEADGCVL